MQDLVIHIGAGNHSSLLDAKYRRLLKNALAHDISKASAAVEKSPLTNTGFGSSLDCDGNASCDCTFATVEGGKLQQVLSLTAVVDCATPTAACQRVLEQVGKIYHPGSARGHLGLLRPSSLTFESARGICPDLPRDDLVLDRTRGVYLRYQEHVAALESLLANGEAGEEATTSELQKQLSPSLSAGVQDTVGFIETGTPVHLACSSGGSFLRLPGRISCAGVYGAGTGFSKAGSVEVFCLCSGNGDDIIKMGLGAHVADNLAVGLLECAEWPELGPILTEIVRNRGLLVCLEAVDLALMSILYVGVIAVVREGQKQRLVFCHSTETFYFGFRSRGKIETVLSRHGKAGTFVCGEYKM